MIRISVQEIIIWMQEQISLGGDPESLYLLLDLVGGISKKELNFLKINPNKELELKESLQSLNYKWVYHIETKKPIQYIAGYAFWRDFKFEVSKKVLIPRVETEQIIEIVLNLLADSTKNISFVDLGTGSGAIAIALAVLKPNWDGFAIDIDKNALDIAINNFKRFSVTSNLSFLCGNWWEPLVNLERNFDIAISNPPYIPDVVFDKLPFEVKNHEPRIALNGGNEGLDHINQIIKDAPKFLKERGWIVLENHFDHGNKIKNILTLNGFNSIKTINDLFGIGRFTIGRYK